MFSISGQLTRRFKRNKRAFAVNSRVKISVFYFSRTKFSIVDLCEGIILMRKANSYLLIKRHSS